MKIKRWRMRRNRLVGVLVFLVVLGVSSNLVSGQELERFSFSEAHMGTEFTIVLYAPSAELASRAAAASFERIDALNSKLSDYLSTSELNRLSESSGSGRPVRVSDDLWTVLLSASRYAVQTEGAFDVTIGPLTRLWRWASRRGVLPDPDKVEAALRPVGFDKLALNIEKKEVMLLSAGMKLDLGGIAKGYAVDEAIEVLASFGLSRVLVDGGGDIAASGPPPGAKGWRVQVDAVDKNGRMSQEERFLSHGAIATSGDTYKYIEVDGMRYSHIVNPKSGYGLTDRLRVTVLATSGMEADALASAISVMGRDHGLTFANQRQGIEAYIIFQEEERFLSLRSTNY